MCCSQRRGDTARSPLTRAGLAPPALPGTGGPASRSRRRFARIHSTSSGRTSRTTLPGDPSMRTPSGKVLPSVISVFEPTIECFPITTRFMSTLFMPIRLALPTVQPWSITLWPMQTSRASVSGKPGSTCSTEPSWTLTRSPMVMRSLSPRMTTLNQTLAWCSRTTDPMTFAPGATNHSGPRNSTLRSPSE